MLLFLCPFFTLILILVILICGCVILLVFFLKNKAKKTVEMFKKENK